MCGREEVVDLICFEYLNYCGFYFGFRCGHWQSIVLLTAWRNSLEALFTRDIPLLTTPQNDIMSQCSNKKAHRSGLSNSSGGTKMPRLSRFHPSVFQTVCSFIYICHIESTQPWKEITMNVISKLVYLNLFYGAIKYMPSLNLQPMWVYSSFSSNTLNIANFSWILGGKSA